MKKLIVMLCCVALAAALCAGALATGLDIQVPTLNDVLVSHRVLLSDSTDEYDEYIVLFYSEGSHVIRQINDETHFWKSAGYTLENVKSYDVENAYPGIGSMAFADVLYSDEGDYICMLVRFKNLDVLANMDQMKAAGILSSDPSQPVYDADFMAENLVAGGMRELSMTEYGGKGLSFTVE